MGQLECCKKITPLDEELNQIFASSPEDNKIPNETGYIGNYGGEYPQDNDNPPSFPYEARYPSRRVEAPPLKNQSPPKQIKYRAQPPQNDIEYYNPLEGTLNPDSKEYIEQLYIRCEAYGKVKNLDDFNFEGWKKFYKEDDKFFGWKKGKNILRNQTKIYNNNDLNNVQIYNGEMNYDNQRHGEGKLTTTKYVRIGEWRNDKFTGWGIEAKRNGESLEGRYVNGLVNGKGIFINKDGDKYIGDFVDSRRHGKGEFASKNIKYIGEFKNNKMDGKGKIKFAEGHEYEGEFFNNQMNGYGKFKWSNGDIYEGEMINGRMNGMGKYIYNNGVIYEGNYNNGTKNGKGKLIYPDGIIFEGEFVDGFPRGKEHLMNDNYNFVEKNENNKNKNVEPLKIIQM